MDRGLYAHQDYGQKRCYKCGSPGRVRWVRHYALGDVYNVCCSNPNCGKATSRNYAYRHSAVAAWNRKPDIWDRLYDNFLEKIVKKLGGEAD